MEAVRNALPKLPYDITDVDLIVSASYSPYDTVATAAHLAQHEFHIENAKALYLSSACSSFLNALEVVEGYFAMGKATKALILPPTRIRPTIMRRIRKPATFGAMRLRLLHLEGTRFGKGFRDRGSIHTRTWLSGKAPDAVHLRPCDGGIMMPEGRDVFIQACTYMPKNVLYLLEKNG